MEITIIDGDDNRYDPELLDIERRINQIYLFVKHNESVAFTRGDRVQMILSSDTYNGSDAPNMVRKREEIRTVSAVCQELVSDLVSCWEVAQIEAVEAVIDAESPVPFIDFG